MKTILTLLVAGCLTGALVTAQSSPAATLYQQALHLQEVKGDLVRAIDLYQTIATKYSNDRAVAPKAMLRLAECYDTLGRSEAAAAYQRVVTSFPNERELVSTARARLAALTGARQVSQIVPRQVATMQSTDLHAVRPDGRIALGKNWQEDEAIYFRDLETGQVTNLGVEGANPTPSPDWRQIAYTTADGQEIRVTPAVPGSAPRMVARTEHPILGLSWTPDGKTIVAVTQDLSGGRGQQQRSWISIAVADGKASVVRTFGPGVVAGGPKWSLDGQFVVFSMGAWPAGGTSQVVVGDLAGTRQVKVSEVAGGNGQPRWTPDGSALVFVNSQGGRDTLWSVKMQGGQPVGPPVMIREMDSSASLLGFSVTGALYEFRWFQNPSNVLFVDRTAQSRITHMVPGGSPSVSPDGKTLVRFRQAASGGRDVLVRSLETGAERILVNRDLNASVSPQWLRDGSGFIVLGWTPGGEAFELVDPVTGSFRPLFPRATPGRVRSVTGVVAPDNRTFYLAAAATAQGPWTDIVGVELATGEERTVAKMDTTGLSQPALALSPDGRTLALMGRKSDGNAHIFAVDLDGSGVRDLTGAFNAFNINSLLRWTPDGQSIIFAARRPDDVGWRIMRVGASGGTPVPDGLDSRTATLNMSKLATGGPISLDLSPDGSQMFVTARVQAWNELWALDNVLAVVAGR